MSPGAIHKPAIPPEELPAGKEITLIPETFRTPVYPVFLALVFGLGGTASTAVVIQSLLSLMTIWLIILLMARMFRPEAAWLAGLLAAVEPLGLIYTHELMTESLFILFILGGFYIFVILLTAGQQKSIGLSWVVLGGLLMGLATLTRPVGLYFPLLLVILGIAGVLVARRQARQARAAINHPDKPPPLMGKVAPSSKYLAVFLVTAVLPPSIWAVRNHYYFNRFLVSSCADHNLLTTITSQMVAKLRNPEGNISTWQIYEELEKELTDKMVAEGQVDPSEPEKAAYFRAWCLEVIKAHPGLFLKYYFKGMVVQFIPDVPGACELLSVTLEGKGALGAVFRQGLRPALMRYFGERWPWWVAGALPLILYDLALYAGAVWGVARLWRSRNFFLLLLILSVIGYWMALAAIGGAPRYRLPLMPLVIILAAWGWFNLSQPTSGRR